MLELTIQDQVYSFNFGMGFLREMNKKVSAPVDGLPGVKRDIGLNYYVARVIDGDMEALVDMLDVANKGLRPRVTKMLLDTYVEDENTDVDKLFEDTKDFLLNANATKKTTRTLLEAVEKAKAE